MDKGNLYADVMYIGFYQSSKQSVFSGILFFLLCLLIPVDLSAQNFKANAKRAEEIQLDEEYLSALGHGATLKQASNNALSALASQISTSVSSDFEYLLQSTKNGSDTDSESKVNSIIKTYSSQTLSNTLELVIKDEPDATVLRYMKKSELDKIFQERKDKVMEYAGNAEKYEQDNKVGDALSSYYAALSLLRSLPDGDMMKMKFGFNDEKLLMPEIAKRVEDILTNLKVCKKSEENDDEIKTILLDITYKGKPVANLNYTYFDGERRSDPCSAKDGLGYIEVPKGLSNSKLDIRAEYICEDEANCDRELRTVLDNTDPVPFRAAKLRLEKSDKIVAEAQKSEQAVTVTGETMDAPKDAGSEINYLDGTAAAPYISVMGNIQKAISEKNYSSINQHFTPEGWEMFNSLINYGNAKVLGKADMKFMSVNGTVTCRSLPMSFSFKQNSRTFVEDVVFRMNSEAKITEVAFGLNKAAVDDIMGRAAWTEESRQIIINFLESYKTAYALKRLDYLNSIFSENALIITGSIVKSNGQKEIGPKNVAHVKYTRQTKAQYMKNLKRCFASNEYVNIHFADNIIRRSGSNPNIYGIQIKQDYYSSSYGDTGYLFLMVDLKDTNAPIIHVRTWQPDKEPGVRDGRIGMQDFQL